MRIESLIKFCIIFLVGFLSANLLNFYIIYGFENPIPKGLGFSDYATNTPSDVINEDLIEITDNSIIIYVENASLGRYAATGSMKPVLDENSNGIRIIPKSEEEINIGDIITFQQDGYLIVHRVIEKSIDSQGTYFITKGDNNSIPDGKVRFEDIKYKTIGILW